MALNENIMIRLMADTSNYTTKMAAASKQAGQFGSALEKPMTTGERFAAGATKAGLAVGALSAAIGVAAVSTFAQFDAAMSTVQANTGASADEMGQLRQAAIDAGANTVYSASEAADAINELGKAGMSTADILSGGLDGALDLAASDGMAVGEAAELMSSAMAQFNLTGKDAGKVADALAAGAGKAQGSARDLGYALQQSGMVANSFGISMTETVGTLTSFANAGMVGSDAGTSLKAMLISLANPSTKARNLMEELGINAYDAQGKFVGLSNLAGQLQDKMSGLSQEQRNQALATIFGTDAIRAANVLYNEGAQGIAEWTKKVNDSGYAAEQAAAKNDNLKGDLENLSGSFESLMISIGSGANGPLRKAVQITDMLVDTFSSMPAPVQQGAVLLGMAAGAAAGLHKMFGSLTTSSSGFARTMSMVVDPVERFKSAGGAISYGGQAIVAAFGSADRQMQVFGTTVSRTQGVMTGLRSIGGSIVDLMGGPWGIALTAAAGLLTLWAQGAQEASNAAKDVQSAFESSGDATEALVDQAMNMTFTTGGILDWFKRIQVDAQNVPDLLDKVGLSVSDMVSAAEGDAGSLAKVNETIKELSKSAGTGALRSQALQRVLDQLTDAYETGSDAAKTKKDALDDLNAATGENTDASSENGDAQSENAQATQEAADAQSILEDGMGATTKGLDDQAASLGEVVDALNTYYGFALSSSDAMIGLYDSFDKATESAQKNGAILDINTAQGRANQSALNDLAQAAGKAAEAQARNGEGMDAINATLDTARERYIAAARAMGMTPEAADAAANAAGLTREQFDRLANSGNQVPDDKQVNVTANDDEAKTRLGELGVTVQTLPNGEVKITGDNTDAINSIAMVNGIPVDPKTGTLTLDSNQYQIALALANGATIDPKTGYLIGDGSDLFNKVAQANGWKIDPKTGVISGDDGPFKAAAQAVENQQIAGKTVSIGADASGFWGTVNSILGQVFHVNVGADSKAHGGIIGYATGGRIPRLAAGGPSGLLGGIGSAVSDSNLIWASRGEYMMNARAVDHYGVDWMDSVNAMRYKPDTKVMPAPPSHTEQSAAPVTYVSKTANIIIQGNGKTDRALAQEILQTLRVNGYGGD